MAQLNDLLVTGNGSICGDLNVSGKLTIGDEVIQAQLASIMSIQAEQDAALLELASLID